MSSNSNHTDAPPGSDAPLDLSPLARAYIDSLLGGGRADASRLVMEAFQEGAVTIPQLYLDVFQPCLREVGRLWECNEVSVAEEHFFTAATQQIISLFYPHIFAGQRRGVSLVATCVGSELHEVGVRMVSDFFEMDGWDTYYLGANTPAADIIDTVGKRQADLVALSVTMSSLVPAAAALIRAIRAEADLGEVKILAGGIPFLMEPELWRKVGADATALDAREAVAVGQRLAGVIVDG